MKGIERELGRIEGTKWGPRLIDIDLLFYDDLVLHEDRLQIPHPRIAGRAFVLIPMLDLDPEMRHPEAGADDARAGRRGRREHRASDQAPCFPGWCQSVWLVRRGTRDPDIADSVRQLRLERPALLGYPVPAMDQWFSARC